MGITSLANLDNSNLALESVYYLLIPMPTLDRVIALYASVKDDIGERKGLLASFLSGEIKFGGGEDTGNIKL